MTGNECLLDTSVVIHSFKNKQPILNQLKEFDQTYVSNTVVGELYYGAYASLDPAKHIRQIELFLSSSIVIPIDTNTAAIYGRLKADLKRKGTPIPENDIWIAASSIANNLPLFITDKHFGLLQLDLIPIA